MAFDISNNWIWIISGVLGAGIYLFGIDAHQRRAINKFVKKNIVWVVLILFYIYAFNYLGFFADGDLFYRKANTYVVMFGLMVIMWGFFVGRERYLTNQFIADGLHGSFSKEPLETENKFLILSLGGIKADGLYFKRGDTIAVVRKETTEYIGENMISIARMKKVRKERLPAEVVYAINQVGHLKGIEDIYYGWFDSNEEEKDFTQEQLTWLEDLDKNARTELFAKIKKTLGLKNPSVGDVVTMLENTSASFNTLSDKYEGVTDIREKDKGHKDRMEMEKRDRYRPPPQNIEGQYS